MTPGPSTAREALLAELYGDLLGAVDRLDAIKAELPQIAASATAGIDEAGKMAAQQVSASGRQAAGQVAQVARTLIEELAKEQAARAAASAAALRDMRGAALLVHSAARKFFVMALAVGLAGGVVGGVLAGVALGKILGAS